MEIWRMIKKWLYLPTRRPSKRHHPDIYPLSIDEIAKELDLKSEAKRLGEAGIPSADDIVITGFEARVVQCVEKARQDYIDWANIRQSVLNEEIERRDVTKVVNQALQTGDEFERKAARVIAESSALVSALSKKSVDYQAELSEFQQKNALIRSPVLHTGAEKFLVAALLFFFILVEGLLNAFFFAQGMSYGLLGGFITAAMFAALNVIVAFFWGKYVIPYLNHRTSTLKVLGLLGVLAAGICMICISLSIAHYRDALTAEAPDAAKTAWETMLSSPVGLHDLMSWFLFFGSLAFAIGALFDGLYSDDRYPGFGKVAHKAKNAKEEFEDELIGIHEQLEFLKEEHLLGLDAAVKNAQSLISQRTGFARDKANAQSRLETALDNARNCLDALLKMFRTENSLNRNGVPIPKYFNGEYELKELKLPDFGIEKDRIELEKQNAMVALLLNGLESVRANIQASFNKQYDGLTPLDEHFQGAMVHI